MSLHADWSNDWEHAFPFHVIHVSSERDAQMGQWCVDFVLFGLGLHLTWVFEQTPLRKQLREQLDDLDWLDSAAVTMPHADYKQLKADAERVPALLERIKELEALG